MLQDYQFILTSRRSYNSKYYVLCKRKLNFILTLVYNSGSLIYSTEPSCKGLVLSSYASVTLWRLRLLATFLYSQQQQSLINSGIEDLSPWISLSRQRRLTEAKYGIGLLSFPCRSILCRVLYFILTHSVRICFFNRYSLTRRQHSRSKSHYLNKIIFGVYKAKQL